MPTILMFVVLMLALAMPASAQEGCAPLDHVLKTIREAVPITRTITLDPEQTANVLLWWNEQPPESNDAYNLAVVIAHPNGRLGLLVGNDGNICATLGLKPDMIESFMEAIAGKPPKAGSI